LPKTKRKRLEGKNLIICAPRRSGLNKDDRMASKGVNLDVM
jgi:hypothetical protein